MISLRSYIAKLILYVFGWRGVGKRPEKNKSIMLAVPHTSNWDFVWLMLFSWSFKVKINWMGKHTLFKNPWGIFMKFLGGVPVFRSSANNLVDQMIENFHLRDEFHLVIPPEGTRGKREYWKSGFYYIALGSKVPVTLAFLDYSTKSGGFGPQIEMTGNEVEDLEKIREFYKSYLGKHPDRMSAIKFKQKT